ncbi:hypothetical protein DAERI_020008 [Deinococcus aerius]|uniref:HMA domain-containing protein n=2 Tax=Deinococcus TaxID=1298 RepID=A0A2I9DI74_9DEIO|nr:MULTISPECIES: heavy metal-associated domain-containing protein [Deinococcus]MBB5293711.1 copper chaperone CopZ [Deinococcus metallilatus]QBY07321.1 heavy-metal-associated domain-containing protein [Deinococcus metallilatus]RXJ14794.1 heavy-metal-associated domain-containing protein [Deinococcus metallilatus]TLK30915.1 heavy-metal-associated domain-containing protein [Deinococcus metallilatus]GBF04411.1 hypothetical protein DAERI_020008 [Deinococcus aerius]
MHTTQRLTIPIDGLGCGGALRAEGVLSRLPGVIRAYVNPATEMGYVEYDPGQFDLSHLRSALARAGFEAGPPSIR